MLVVRIVIKLLATLLKPSSHASVGEVKSSVYPQKSYSTTHQQCRLPFWCLSPELERPALGDRGTKEEQTLCVH
ncbi:hypothetical protein Y1Q_0003307 [Alligator mississippiensis]|uniref:Secreted protein n=1 Tax=Alligator mississippiensis TaxID=8496 RepID=A0A151MEA4_ALLMI|nr:hypothetical protein Y1Q_0003307 [Alligator mississippiensis]